jgi:carbon monoxide dehydrogenase subunit G
MELTGSYTLYAPRERVWAFLLDPVRLARAIPGCEQLDALGEDRFHLRLTVGVAAVKGTYNGTLRIGDRHEPESFRIAVEGAGARGVLRGEGQLALTAQDAMTTVVSYAGQAQLGGAIAGLGSRVAQNAARMLINQFFARMADALGDTSAGGAPEVAAQPAAAQTTEMRYRQPLPDGGAGVPEARPLAFEAGHVEARPLESPTAAPTTPASRGAEPPSAPNAPTPGHPAVPNPAPAFLTDFVRRTGLSDGSIESEQRVAWGVVFAVAGTLAVLALLALVGVLVGRRRP